MENKQNAEFAKEALSNRDVQIYWKHDFKLLKEIPKILCAKTFESSKKNLRNNIAPHESAKMIFMFRLRSYIGLALAEIIIEDYISRVEKNATMYTIELQESKTFFDSYVLEDYLEIALKATDSKEECIKQLKGVFGPIFKREKTHLIKKEEIY